MPDIADLRLKFSSTGEGAVKRDLREIDGEIRGVEKDAHSAGGALRGMFANAAGFALGGGILGLIGQVKGAIGGIINADAAMEQSKVILTQVTGSAERANQIIGDVQKMAAKTPFSFPELITATQNLESFGLDSQKWLQVIGDTAAGTGKSVDQVTQAVLDAHTGQYERLKELNVDAQIEGDKLVFTYAKNGKQIRKEVDKTNQDVIDSTLQAIWNDKYEGMMEAQSHTFIGQWSTLKDNVSMLAQQMSGGIFSALEGVIGFANDVFAVGWKQAIQNAFGDSPFGGFLQDLGTFVSDMIAAFGEGAPVEQIIQNLPGSWRDIARDIGKVADAFGDLKSAYDSGGIGGLLDQLGSELSQIAKAGIDLAVIGVKATFKLISNVTGSIDDWLKNQLFGGGDPMLTGLPGAVPPIPIDEVLVKIGQWLLDKANDFSTWLGEELNKAGISVTLHNWHMKIGKPDVDPTVDFDIGAYVAKALINPSGAGSTVTLPEGTADQARQSGQGIGEQLFGWTVEGVKAGFDLMSGGGGDKAKGDSLNKTIGEAVIGIFQGAFNAAGVALNAAVDPSFLQTWADAGMNWLQSASDAFMSAFGGSDATSGVGAGSHTEHQAGIVEKVVKFFTDLPGQIKEGVGAIKILLDPPTLPDWLNSLGWLTDKIDALKKAFSDLAFWRNKVSNETAPAPTGGFMGVGGIPASVLYGGEPKSSDAPDTNNNDPNAMPVGLTTAVKVPAPDFSAFTGGLQAMFTSAQSNQQNVTNEFVALRNNAQTLADATNAAVTNAFVGMRNNVASLMADTVNVVVSSLSGLSGMAGGEGFAIGAALGSGIYQGIVAWATTIAAAAASTVTAAVLAARSAADAHSPSRKMMALGNDMMAGLLIPLHGGRSQVAGAMNNLLTFPAGGRYGGAQAAGGGSTIYDLRGAFIGGNLDKEIQRRAAAGTAKQIRGRQQSRAVAGARLG